MLLSGAAAAAPPPALSARAWLLVDAASGATLAAHEPAQRLEPASLTKLMTAYVVFIGLAEGRITLSDTVKVSPAAFAAPGRDGARMYIEPGRPVTVRELLQGMLVASANDAAVALAEHTSGLRLGTDFPQHRALFAEREVSYNGVTQANRNRLLWSDPGVDGMKTGHHSAAGWSLVASASRPRGSGDRAFQRRLIAVVLGAPSDALRAQEALRLLNYGFAEHETVLLLRGGATLTRAEVWKGDRSMVPLGPERDVYVTLPVEQLQRLGAGGLRTAIERPDPMLAPLARGETVGRLKVTADGRTLTDAPIVALEPVAPAGLLGRAYDAVRLWWRRRE